MKVVLGGCARDIANVIKISLNDMIKVGEECSDYVIIVYENDSVDRTFSILHEYSLQNSKVIIISEKNVPGSRTERLSHGRNKILTMIRARYAHFDFFINMDMDYERPITFSFLNLLSSWKDEWNVLTAVSRDRYYDWWALRSEDILPYDCWNPRENADGDCSIIHAERSRNMPKNIIKVDSAFNGIGIYKIDTLIAKHYCKYIGKLDSIDICEHVEFHKCLGNVYIHPSIISETWTDTPNKTQFHFFTVLLIIILALFCIGFYAKRHLVK